MCFCLGRVTVSVQNLKCHPRIIFVSANPPSAFNFSCTTMGSQGIGLLTSFGRAATLIARGIAALTLSALRVPGRSMVSLVVLSM
jgi:hypothetical protein